MHAYCVVGRCPSTPSPDLVCLLWRCLVWRRLADGVWRPYGNSYNDTPPPPPYLSLSSSPPPPPPPPYTTPEPLHAWLIFLSLSQLRSPNSKLQDLPLTHTACDEFFTAIRDLMFENQHTSIQALPVAVAVPLAAAGEGGGGVSGGPIHHVRRLGRGRAGANSIKARREDRETGGGGIRPGCVVVFFCVVFSCVKFLFGDLVYIAVLLQINGGCVVRIFTSALCSPPSPPPRRLPDAPPRSSVSLVFQHSPSPRPSLRPSPLPPPQLVFLVNTCILLS